VNKPRNIKQKFFLSSKKVIDSPATSQKWPKHLVSYFHQQHHQDTSLQVAAGARTSSGKSTVKLKVESQADFSTNSSSKFQIVTIFDGTLSIQQLLESF